MGDAASARTRRAVGGGVAAVVCAAVLAGGALATSHGVSSASGFTMPSRLVTCAYLAHGDQRGLFCAARYIKKMAYDGQGVVELPVAGRARYVASGNDILLYIGGWTPTGARKARPKLLYGSVWRHAGFTCRSRRTGVDCRRGGHGFHLSTDRIRLH